MSARPRAGAAHCAGLRRETNGQEGDDRRGQRAQHEALPRPARSAAATRPLRTRNGLEALDLAREHRPDLILMDIQLPEVSGLEVTKWLKEDDELHVIPVIAVTAFAMKGDEERIRAGRLRGLHLEADLGAALHRDDQIVSRRRVMRAMDADRSLSAMTARILVVDDIPANVKLLEARLLAEYFEVLTATNGAGGARDLRERQGRRRPARRHDAGHGRLRGLPPPQGRSGDRPHSGGHGHRARPGRPTASAAWRPAPTIS